MASWKGQHNLCVLKLLSFREHDKETNMFNEATKLWFRGCDGQDEQLLDDPEPIMVDEDDADDLLAAILEGEIGLGNREWDGETRRRYAEKVINHHVWAWGNLHLPARIRVLDLLFCACLHGKSFFYEARICCMGRMQCLSKCYCDSGQFPGRKLDCQVYEIGALAAVQGGANCS